MDSKSRVSKFSSQLLRQGPLECKFQQLKGVTKPLQIPDIKVGKRLNDQKNHRNHVKLLKKIHTKIAMRLPCVFV